MILGKTTPHALGRAGGLAVLILGVFLLPLVAGVSRADEEEQQDRRGSTKDFGRGGDDKELARLAEELKARLAEVEKARAALAEAAKKKAEAAKEKAAKDKDRAKEAAKGGATIHIEISGADAKDVEKLAADLKKALAGKDVRVTVTRAEHKDGKHDGWPKEGFRFEFRDAPGMKGGWKWGREEKQPAPRAEAPKKPEKAEAPKKPEPPQPPAPRTSDKRVDEVEKKLDALIRELEALKKELKGGDQKDEKERPRGRGFGGFPSKR